MNGAIDHMSQGYTGQGGYDTQPTVALPEGERILRGAEAWRSLAHQAVESAESDAPVLLVDAYPGVHLPTLIGEISAALPDWTIRNGEDAALPSHRIDEMIAANLTDDRVFGVMSHARVSDFYDHERMADLARDVSGAGRPTVVVGWGAAIIAPLLATGRDPVVVLVDMARWEIQQRQRAGAGNWRADNGSEDTLRKYKRGFFVEWRAADRHKMDLFERIDAVIDGNAIAPSAPSPDRLPAGMISGAAFRQAMADAARRPFRVVPFFDPGVWGGQWMKSVIGLDPSAPNYAWCFDCVPEENSLLLEGEGGVIELPALDLVLTRPAELLGERTFARFGAEFPIRFDFLDTMEGGNLSLQVHPLTDYIQRTFGMHYTQDESYYMLDAGEDAVVYLGLRDDVEPARMMEDLRRATSGEAPFDAARYVNTYPARKHDHFSIPAGTVHCSGADSMVLEISATPYIFTFKLWDWGRVGLDGVPRPVHLDHGEANIQWNRDSRWVADHLLDQVEVVSEADGVTEERTGLHELEFIETRRHWFTDRAVHDTRGTVNVLNLVEGDEVRVVSPSGDFAPFVVHYAETFIVPAAVGSYVIEKTDRSRSARFATIKAYVRGTFVEDRSTAQPTPRHN
ncbi:class I mannose-6-phosphate isomerase [Microbacterium chocolatum]|uniref:class I mannose-6-phosphate isomerase n=1 Tax=Microbacterium aurantiacum TaxID=162393 RepID=UPI0033901A52